jgi:hypothetical protein
MLNFREDLVLMEKRADNVVDIMEVAKVCLQQNMHFEDCWSAVLSDPDLYSLYPDKEIFRVDFYKKFWNLLFQLSDGDL